MSLPASRRRALQAHIVQACVRFVKQKLLVHTDEASNLKLLKRSTVTIVKPWIASAE